MKVGWLFGLTILSNVVMASCQWDRDPSQPYKNLLFPDTNAVYYRFHYKVPQGTRSLLRIKGTFPHARYSNFTLYDLSTLDPVGKLGDWEIAGANGAYTVWAGTERPTFAVNNFIAFPAAKDGFRWVDLWYRIYAPDLPSDPKAGVELPTIEAVDPETGGTIACPESVDIPEFPFTSAKDIPHSDPTRIVFSKNKASATEGEPDNTYGIAELKLTKDRPVAVVRFKMPSIPAQVRYFSMCLTSVSGQSSTCLSDRDIRLDSQGFATVVVGPETLKEAVLSKGLNFIPRGTFFLPFLIARNLVAQNFKDVLKNDYLPKGDYYSVSDFLSSVKLEATSNKPGVSVSEVSVAPVVAPQNSHVFRIGLSWDLVLGQMWARSIMGSKPDPLQIGLLLKGMERGASENLKKLTGYDVSLELSSADLLTEELDKGILDAIFIPGENFEFIRRISPSLEPLAYCSNYDDDRATSTSLLLANSDLVAKRNLRGPVFPEELRGLTLAVGAFRSHTLFSLEKWLREYGSDPIDFFKKPQNSYDEMESPVDDVVDGVSDIVPVDDAIAGAYSRRKPGRWSRLVTLKVFEPVPLPMLVYNPLKVRPEVEELVDKLTEKGLDKSIRENEVVMDHLGRYLGASRIYFPKRSMVSALQKFQLFMKDIAEYFLPVRFFHLEDK